MQIRAVLAIGAMLSLAIVPVAHGAAHGLDNNWKVSITGEKDANECFRFTSVDDIKDVAKESVPHEAANSQQEVKCVGGSDTCEEGYDCDAAAAKKPSTFKGCTFNTTSAAQATVTGFIMDDLCYSNFIVEQKDHNGAPGLAPDKVHVRTEAQLHTRSCLLVSYCSRSGFRLVEQKSAGGNFEQVVHLDVNSTEKVFDWLVTARHSCSEPSKATGVGAMATPLLACGISATIAALAA